MRRSCSATTSDDDCHDSAAPHPCSVPTKALTNRSYVEHKRHERTAPSFRGRLSFLPIQDECSLFKTTACDLVIYLTTCFLLSELWLVTFFSIFSNPMFDFQVSLGFACRLYFDLCSSWIVTLYMLYCRYSICPDSQCRVLRTLWKLMAQSPPN